MTTRRDCCLIELVTAVMIAAVVVAPLVVALQLRHGRRSSFRDEDSFPNNSNTPTLCLLILHLLDLLKLYFYHLCSILCLQSFNTQRK